MAILKEAPSDAREMHARIYNEEQVELPPELNFLLNSMQNEATGLGKNQSTTLLASVKQESIFIRDALEEQTIARTLLERFGLPYLPGAETVWLTLSEYLNTAKKATEQAQLQLNQAVEQIRALLVYQLKIEQEAKLKTLREEEKKHQSGITILDKSGQELTGENSLSARKDGAVTKKKERLNEISIEKKGIEEFIQAITAMAVNLMNSASDIGRFGSAELVMS